jgi:transglutaminase-like putative cysteine protease
MRVRVHHQTSYHYDAPVHSLIQVMRLTPRNHESQFIHRWRIDLDVEATLRAGEDAFGNCTHMVYIPGPLTDITVTVEGQVETHDTNGVIAGTSEPFPPRLFLRETPLTHCDTGMVAFAHDAAATSDPLDQLHGLLTAIHREIEFDTEITHAATTAEEAFRLRSGVCQDLTHIFLGGARVLGIPARYVGGYLLRQDGKANQAAGHAWAEAFVDGLGWVGFDAANGICATDAHVRVAVGLDYLGAAPLRGARSGIAAEQLSVSVVVDEAQRQHQA